MSTGFKDWYTRISVSCGQITVAHNSTHVNKPSNVNGRWGSHQWWLEQEIQAEWPLSLLGLGGVSFPFRTTVLDKFPEHALPVCSRSTSGPVSAPRSLVAHTLRVSPKTPASFSPGITRRAWPEDLQSAHVTRGDALLRVRRLSARAAGIQSSTTNGNWVECHCKDVKISSFLFFAKRRSNAKSWHLCFFSFHVGKSLSLDPGLFIMFLLYLWWKSKGKGRQEERQGPLLLQPCLSCSSPLGR